MAQGFDQRRGIMEEEAREGWAPTMAGTVGMIHSHPGERCFYFFPGTRVASSDAKSFALQSYSIDAIMCGDSVVWVNRDLVQRELALTDRPMPQASELAPGNRVRDGSLNQCAGRAGPVNEVQRFTEHSKRMPATFGHLMHVHGVVY